jgi:hypothetical protein
MLQDIEQHIDLVEKSISWAKEFNKDSFPYDVFKNYRRQLKRIYNALSDNCSAAAYGESQVGKSYLMSGLLSSPDVPFVITNAGRSYSFIDDINPSGGNNAKVESTGVITRFTLEKANNPMKDYVKVRNLSVVDIILLLTDSYYNDIKINPDNVLKYNDINTCLEQISGLWNAHIVQHDKIEEDDIKDINDYIRDTIGNAATSVIQSNFCKIVAPIIQYVAYDKWVDIFSLLWNKNTEISHLFSVLINEYKKLDFNTEVYVPFDAVLREKGTLLKIDWLDTVCDIKADTGNDIIYTDVYDIKGNVIAHDFNKGNLSALIAELTFELPATLASERRFLEKIDLLDFPGARSREKFKEADIHTVLPKVLRRGKVAYLFNKYSHSLKISSVLFCHHNDQKAEATIGDTINNWIEDNIGATPEDRANMLTNTDGIAPLFFIATKFNIDLERTKTDNPDTKDRLAGHWNRFDTVFPEIIKPNRWLDEWASGEPIGRINTFQNIYPLRDFYWSGKKGVFDGYSDGAVKSEEKSVHKYADYPEYFEDLKESFLQNEFVKKHFANPEKTWNDVATINNDGSKAIIHNLDAISDYLDDARKQKYLIQLQKIKQEMFKALSVYFEPEDNQAKNMKVKQVVSDIKRSFTFSVGAQLEIFGHIIDTLMVPVGDLRDIAYDIIICHTDEPKDFSLINFVRIQAGIDVADSKEVNVRKLCDYFICDDIKLIEQDLKKKGCTVEEIISAETETLTTIADVVTKHIIDYWKVFLQKQVKQLEECLPQADEVVFMLTSLLKKLGVKKIISEKIDRYCKVFSINEQPNAIADYASLTLNNFVSSAGRNYMGDKDIEAIRAKADKCHVTIDLSPTAWNVVSRPQSLLTTLEAFDKASNINNVSMETLMKLPLWNNFKRWENLVTIGLLYASDISHVDPVANAKVKVLLEKCESLYKY